MADMTSVLKLVPHSEPAVPNVLEWRSVDLNFGATANAAMKAAGTHNILTIPVNYVFVGGYVLVHTKVASTSNDTIQFKVGSDTWTAAIAADGTEWDAGDVVALTPNDYDDTAGTLGFAKSAGDTLDMVVDDHALTAGRLLLYACLIDIHAW